MTQQPQQPTTTTVSTPFADATVQSLIALGRETAGPQTVQTIPGNPVPYLVYKGEVKTFPELVFNGHGERPERVKGTVKVFDPASFVAYYRQFADDHSRVFADDAARTVTAVLDYHEGAKADAARWGAHRVMLELRHSEEWKTWLAGNNKKMSQQEFAEFLEQNAMDISHPQPAAILDVARDLQGTTEVEFGAGVRTSNGQVRFKYTETVRATVGGEKVEVPESFTIAIPVFIGANITLIQALLRFRLNQGKLTFFYTLVRPEQRVREAFADARTMIAADLGAEIINGIPA